MMCAVTSPRITGGETYCSCRNVLAAVIYLLRILDFPFPVRGNGSFTFIVIPLPFDVICHFLFPDCVFDIEIPKEIEYAAPVEEPGISSG